ncbi:JAB domain-containing protein [Algoriphagus sp. AGSA1]|uniref:JAB domain-containing protein n=1 Tax=unclassified Algoriphagus TaxID=2641541 RepID=UPI00178771B0|nr:MULTISPECIES: JAB domain-containing protein [unclassified Algoriphagus]MCE7056292.1 JAB domain-containing protein [Algoriphagus sp. AGSA1]
METQERKIDLYEVAEIKLGYSAKVKSSQRPRVASSRQVHEVFAKVWDQERIGFVEDFKVMLLSRANRVLGIVTISSGGTAGTVVDVKLVYAAAIKANASSVILAHNHPSGNLMPSEQDKRLTQRIKEAGKILDIPVLDHLILAEEGYYSFVDYGEL